MTPRGFEKSARRQTNEDEHPPVCFPHTTTVRAERPNEPAHDVAKQFGMDQRFGQPLTIEAHEWAPETWTQCVNGLREIVGTAAGP